MVVLILILIGSLVGLISSFFGIGGGIVTIPALFTLFPHLSPETAIGCSFGMILCNATANSLNFYKSGILLKKNFLILMILGLISGVGIGSYLTSIFPSSVIKQIFGYFIIIVALKNVFDLWMLKRKGASNSNSEFHLEKVSFWIFKTLIVGFLSGLISGLTGLGGGIIMIPLFLFLLKVPFKLLSPYSNFLMMFGAGFGLLTHLFKGVQISEGDLPSLFTHFQFGEVNFAIIFLLMLGGAFTSKIGVKLNKKSSEKTSKLLFIGLLLIMSGKILFF